MHRRFSCRYCTERFTTRELRDQHLSTHVRTQGTQMNHQANLGCRLLIPTRYRGRVQEYHESEASRRARERARELDPLGLLESDVEERERARDW